MRTILPSTNLDRMLINLNAEEQADPTAILEEFCDEYTPGELRERFSQLQETALVDDAFNDPSQRDHLIVFCKMAVRALEAAYLIGNENSAKVVNFSKESAHTG